METAFCDEELERRFLERRFKHALLLTCTCFGAAGATVVGFTIVDSSSSKTWLPLIFGFMHVTTLLAHLSVYRHPDESRARTLLGRMWSTVCSVGSVGMVTGYVFYSPPAGTAVDSGESGATQDALTLFFIAFGVHFLFFNVEHKLISLLVPLGTHIVAPCWPYLSHLDEVLLIAIFEFAGLALGAFYEHRVRSSFLALQVKSAAGAKPQQAEPEGQQLQTIRLHPLTLRFSDDELERQLFASRMQSIAAFWRMACFGLPVLLVPIISFSLGARLTAEGGVETPLQLLRSQLSPPIIFFAALIAACSFLKQDPKMDQRRVSIILVSATVLLWGFHVCGFVVPIMPVGPANVHLALHVILLLFIGWQVHYLHLVFEAKLVMFALPVIGHWVEPLWAASGLGWHKEQQVVWAASAVGHLLGSAYERAVRLSFLEAQLALNLQQQALEAAGQVVLRLRLLRFDKPVITQASRGFVHAFGRELVEGSSDFFFSLWHQSSHEAVTAAVCRAAGERCAHTRQLLALRADGVARLMDCTFVADSVEGDCVSAIIRDVTDTADLRRDVEAIQASMHTLIVTLSLDLTVQKLNDCVLSLLSTSLAEAAGLDFVDNFVVASGQKAARRMLTTVLAGGTVGCFELRMAAAADGGGGSASSSEVDTLWTARLMRDVSGQAVGVSCVGQDISAVKAAQAEADRNRQRWFEADRRAFDAEGRAQEEMAAYLFHELRNDTTAMRGVLEEVCECVSEGRGSLPSQLRVMVDDSLVHAHHSVQVITNVLDFSKLRAGKLQLPSIKFQLDSLVRESARLVRHLVRDRPVALRTETPSPPLELVGAPLHLQQVLVNLLTNACKYTDEGHVQLCVSISQVASAGDGSASMETAPEARRQQTLQATPATQTESDRQPASPPGPSTRSADMELPQPSLKPHQAAATRQGLPGGSSDASTCTDGASHSQPAGVIPTTDTQGTPPTCAGGSSRFLPLKFLVVDTGPGIPAEHQASIFEPFAQTPRAGVQPGTGLGLTLCRSLISKMGGTLALEQLQNRGCAFAFTIELQLAERAEPPIEQGDIDKEPLPPLRLLIADDIMLNRALLKRKLGRILPIAELMEASTGEEALGLVKSHGFDLIVLDEHFSRYSKMLGSHVTRLIREHERALNLPPTIIIGCTGQSSPEHNSNAVSLGQDLVWGKPFPDEQEILRDIRAVMRTRNSE